MLKVFLVMALLTSSAFATDVNEISGTFNPEKDEASKFVQNKDEKQEDVYSANTFVPVGESTRMPANQSKQKESYSVNDITGTFQ